MWILAECAFPTARERYFLLSLVFELNGFVIFEEKDVEMLT